MKQLAALYDMSLDRLGEAVYHRLEEIYPEGKGPYVFGVNGIPVEDPRFGEIMTCLAQNGFYPGGFTQQPDQFGFTIFRRYDLEDFEACSFLAMHPSGTLSGSASREPNGQLQINAPRKKICFDFPANNLADVIIVSNAVKLAMEDAELKKLLFTPTILVAKKGKPSSTPDTLAPYWELSSSLILPPMSPRMLMLNGAGEPSNGDYSKGCFLREGKDVPDVSYNPVEVHYTESSLKAVPPFDLAFAQEQSGRSHSRLRYWIASKRFYDFCFVHKLKIDWVPVRIDKG